VTCKRACEKGIIINTIQCGSDPDCTKVWKDIAVKAEGSYAAIPQEGGVVAVATPFDKRLGEINRELARTTLVYGLGAMRDAGVAKAEEAARLPESSAAERAGYFAKRGGKAASYDLLDRIKEGKMKLEDVKEKDLPDELKKLKTLPERKAYLDKLDKRRQVLSKEALALDRKRAVYIKKELAKKGKGKDSFDGNVLEMLRKQAKKHKIAY
jgi:hypothetical protein